MRFLVKNQTTNVQRLVLAFGLFLALVAAATVALRGFQTTCPRCELRTARCDVSTFPDVTRETAGTTEPGGRQQQPAPAELALPPSLLPAVTAAAAAAGLSRHVPTLGARSSPWAPLVLSTCMEGMPPHFAPCLVGSSKNVGVAYGEEVVYPDFSIPQPHFINEQHAASWRATVEKSSDYEYEKFFLRDGRAFFLAQHGQNLVLRNVTFRDNPETDAWSSGGCMKFNTHTSGLEPLPANQTPEWARVVLANSPDSFSLQHFLDRVTKMLVQTEGWRQEGTRVASGATPGLAFVQDVWRELLTPEGEGEQLEQHDRYEFSAEELVFPCRCPVIHPFFQERLRELMHRQMPADAVPPKNRKAVLYLSRNGGGGKQERRVTNEAAVLKAIKGVLADRKRGEELVMFDPGRFPHVADLAAYMAANVSAIVGPHGGAWYNMWWAGRDTLLLEFMPLERPALMNWAEGSVAGQPYWVIPCASKAPEHDMEVDPQAVAKILREQLGKTAPGGPRPHYHWDLSLLT